MTQPWDSSDPDDFEDAGDDSQKPNPVRKRMRELEEANKQLKKQNEQLTSQMRQNTISQVVQSKGLNSKIAALVPADVEPTVEAIDAWLQNYVDIFAPSQVEDSSDEDSGDAEDDGAGQYGQEMGRISEISGRAKAPTDGRQAELARELASKDLSRERLLELIEQHGGGFGTG